MAMVEYFVKGIQLFIYVYVASIFHTAYQRNSFQYANLALRRLSSVSGSNSLHDHADQSNLINGCMTEC